MIAQKFSIRKLIFYMLQFPENIPENLFELEKKDWH